MTIFQSELTYPATATAVAVIGAVFDVKSRRIPNLVTVTAFLLGLTMHFALGGWRQLLNSLIAGVLCGLVFLVFYIAGGMGAGDVKLMMAVGCIAGGANAEYGYVAYILMFTAICGGVMAVGLVLIRGRIHETAMNMSELISHHAHKGLQPHPDLNIGNAKTLRLPYALAIAGGCMLTLLMMYRGAV